MSQTVGPIELPRNSRVVLLSLVPGLGHFYLDRFAMGSLLFAGFVTALNAWFLGSMLHSLENPELLRNVAGVTVVLIWAAGMYHAYRLSYGTDRVALAKERRELIRRALIHYLRDELEEARKLLAHAVDLDVDWVDPDPLFHLGVVLARLAERAALRSASEARGLRRRALSVQGLPEPGPRRQVGARDRRREPPALAARVAPPARHLVLERAGVAPLGRRVDGHAARPGPALAVGGAPGGGQGPGAGPAR
ncbi:MAG: hypothetical protein R3F62_20525 [Planctomycetota bacterium]